MKRIISLLVVAVAILAGTSVYAQGNMRDVVYLKNGGMVKGIIVEQVPGVSIKLQTSDGSLFVYKFEEIEKMTKEQYAAAELKSPGLAWALSFFIPGAGQMYNGQVGKGVAMLVGSAVCLGVGAAIGEGRAVTIIGLVGHVGIWAWSQIDAYNTAKKINLGSGMLSLNFGDGTHLTLRPDVSVVNVPVASGRPVLASGLNLSLSF